MAYLNQTEMLIGSSNKILAESVEQFVSFENLDRLMASIAAYSLKELSERMKSVKGG